MSELVTYSKFYTAEDAIPLTDLLKQENIPFSVEKEINQIDSIYIGESLDPMIAVKVPQNLFEKVTALLEAKAPTDINEVDPSYYLFSFTEQELLNVVQNPEEWNPHDVTLAKKLLAERNIDIPVATQESIADPPYKPERLKESWIIGGYVFSLLISFVGLFWGLSVVTSTKVLKDGTRVKIYDAYSRKHGRIILIIGIIMMTLYILRGLSLWPFNPDFRFT